MLATRIPTAARDVACDALVDLLDAGTGTAKLRVYSGAQPASANDAATGTLLVEFDLPDPVFGASSSGTATANSIDPSTGLDDGNAGWFRAVDADDNTVLDGAAGPTGSGAELQMNTVSIVDGGTVSVTAWTATMPAG